MMIHFYHGKVPEFGQPVLTKSRSDPHCQVLNSMLVIHPCDGRITGKNNSPNAAVNLFSVSVIFVISTMQFVKNKALFKKNRY